MAAGAAATLGICGAGVAPTLVRVDAPADDRAVPRRPPAVVNDPPPDGATLHNAPANNAPVNYAPASNAPPFDAPQNDALPDAMPHPDAGHSPAETDSPAISTPPPPAPGPAQNPLPTAAATREPTPAARLRTPPATRPATLPATRPATLPAANSLHALDAYEPLVRTCERFETAVRRVGWRDVYFEDFDPDAPVTWSMAEPAGMLAQLTKRVTEEKTTELAVDLTGRERGQIQLGGPIRGEFAVEYRAKFVSKRMSDMSIVCRGINRAPQFSFGGWENTRNVLFVAPDAPGLDVQTELDPKENIHPNQWQRVRLEVAGGFMTGYIDDRQVGRVPWGKMYKPGLQSRICMYFFASDVRVDWARIQRPGNPAPADADRLWRGVAGDLSRDDATRLLGGLCDALYARDPDVRDAATHLLARCGRAAEPALRVALHNGRPEAQERAAGLIKRIDDGAAALDASKGASGVDAAGNDAGEDDTGADDNQNLTDRPVRDNPVRRGFPKLLPRKMIRPRLLD